MYPHLSKINDISVEIEYIRITKIEMKPRRGDTIVTLSFSYLLNPGRGDTIVTLSFSRILNPGGVVQL